MCAYFYFVVTSEHDFWFLVCLDRLANFLVLGIGKDITVLVFLFCWKHLLFIW